MKKRILEVSKKELQRTINNMDMGNLTATQGRINHIFNMLYNINSLPDMPDSSVKTVEDSKPYLNVTVEPSEEETIEEESEPAQPESAIKETPSESKSESAEDAFPAVDTVERKVRGGVLPEVGAFIPEGVIRRFGIEHGDRVEATPLDTPYESDGQKRFSYTVVGRGPGVKNEEVVEMDQCVVTYDPDLDSLIVSEMITDSGRKPIEVEGHDVSYFEIDPKDAKTMNINEGDIVDIAFYEGNPSSMRVRWRFSYDEEVAPKPKKSSYYKSNADTGSDSESVEQTLQGKTIGIVGGESMWSSYREAAEKRGGTVFTKFGNEPVSSIENMVRRCDCVFVIIDEVSHRAAEAARDSAKKYSVAHDYINLPGRSSFLAKIDELLMQNQK